MNQGIEMKKTEKREREKAPEGLVPLFQQYLPILIPHLQQHVKQLVYWKTITLQRERGRGGIIPISVKMEAMHATSLQKSGWNIYICHNVFLTHLILYLCFLPFTQNTFLQAKTMRMQWSQDTLLLTWHCIEVDCTLVISMEQTIYWTFLFIVYSMLYLFVTILSLYLLSQKTL